MYFQILLILFLTVNYPIEAQEVDFNKSCVEMDFTSAMVVKGQLSNFSKIFSNETCKVKDPKQLCGKLSNVPEANFYGTCFANAASSAFTYFTQVPHPLEVALNHWQSFDLQNEDYSGGYTCKSFKDYTNREFMCSQAIFNDYYGFAQGQFSISEMFNQIKKSDLTSITSTIDLWKLLIKSLNYEAGLSNNVLDSWLKSVKVENHQLVWDEKQFNLLKSNIKYISQPAQKIFNRLTDPKQWSEFYSLLYKNHSTLLPAERLNLAKVKLAAFDALCTNAHAMVNNPFYNTKMDTTTINVSSTQLTTKEYVGQFHQLMMDKYNEQFTLPDFVGICYNRFFSSSDPECGGHAYSVLGQTYRELNHNKFCYIKLLDSNPHQSSSSCVDNPELKIVAEYDPVYQACYYYVPKYTLFDKNKNIILNYCKLSLASEQST